MKKRKTTAKIISGIAVLSAIAGLGLWGINLAVKRLIKLLGEGKD